MRISRNLLQNPKESHHQALRDLKDTEIETSWFGFCLKNRKIINCYQSYLSYYLLILYFISYYMALNQFLWWSYYTYGLKEKILYTQQNGSFVAVGTFIKFCECCITYELTLHVYQEKCIVTTSLHHNW